MTRFFRDGRRWAGAAGLLLALGCSQAPWRRRPAPAPPAARDVPEFLRHHRARPLPRLREHQAAATQAWMKAHSDACRATLARIPAARHARAAQALRRQRVGARGHRHARARRPVLLPAPRRPGEPVQALHAPWPQGHDRCWSTPRRWQKSDRQAARHQLLQPVARRRARWPTVCRCRAPKRRCCTCWT